MRPHEEEWEEIDWAHGMTEVATDDGSFVMEVENIRAKLATAAPKLARALLALVEIHELDEHELAAVRGAKAALQKAGILPTP